MQTKLYSVMIDSINQKLVDFTVYFSFLVINCHCLVTSRRPLLLHPEFIRYLYFILDFSKGKSKRNIGRY